MSPEPGHERPPAGPFSTRIHIASRQRWLAHQSIRVHHTESVSVRALDRRGPNRQTSRVLSYGPLAIDPADHRVTLSGHHVSLTATEYRLLEYLVRRAECIVTRDQLAEYVWGTDYDPGSNVADVYVGYVRRKLQAASAPSLIHTVRGFGYILKHEGVPS